MANLLPARDGLLTLRARLGGPRPEGDAAARELSLVAHLLQLVSPREESDAEPSLAVVSGPAGEPRAVDASISGRTARVVVQRLDALQEALTIAGEAVRGVGLPLPEREHEGLTSIERVQVRLRAYLAFAEPRDEQWLADALDRARQSTLELLAEAGAARLTFTVAGWRSTAIA